MNIFKRARLAFKLARQLEGKILGSEMTTALFRFVRSGQPIWLSIDSLDVYIEDFYKDNPDFAAIIDFLSEKAAYVNWDFFDGDNPIEEGEIIDVWDCPNALQGGYEFRREHFAFFWLFGENFINGVKRSVGDQTGWIELWNFPSTVTDLIGGGAREPVKSIRFGSHTTATVPYNEVLHMKNFNPNYDEEGTQLRGMSKAISLVKAVTGSSAAYNAIVTELQQQHPTGFLKLKHGGVDFTNEEIIALQHKIAKSKSDEIPFTNQDIDYVLMGGTLVKKDTMDSILSNLRTVCRRYSISSRLFNDPQASTFNNMISDERRAWEDAIKPIVKQFEDELNAWFCPAFGPNITMRANYKHIAALQKDMKEIAAAIKSMDFLTLEEKYELAEIEPKNPDDPELQTRGTTINLPEDPEFEELEDDEDANDNDDE